jgi:Na+/melibiose symporter-like transporter
MIEIILAAVLIAFGIMSIYFSIGSGTKDPKLMFILFLGAACIVAGAWLLISSLTLILILKRLVGLALAGIGLFIVIGFPDVKDYQSFDMSKAGVFIGLILLVIGIYFLFF